MVVFLRRWLRILSWWFKQPWVLGLLWLGSMVLTVWFHRWSLLEHFDASYLEDFYTHSQWTIPQSSRVMGDSPLYQFAGYRLMQGDNFFSINPETPPVGKYIYGLAAVYLGNAYLGSWILYGLALAFFWLMLRELRLPRATHWTALFFFTLSPLLMSQITSTLIDLPQLVWLLAHLFTLWRFRRAHSRPQQWLWIILASGALGLMSASKIALFLPLILVADAWYLWQTKRWQWWLVLPLGAGLTYVATFLPYFLQGNSFISWLKAEKWVLNFYRDSDTKANPLVTLSVVLFGWFRGWWDQGWTYISDWTLVWPLGFAGGTTWLVRHLRQPLRHSKHPELDHLFWLAWLLLGTYLLIPFWPRYLLLILPWLAIGAAQLLTRLPIRWQGVLWLGILWPTLLAWRPSPQNMLSLFTSSWEVGAAADMHAFLDPQTRSDWPREAWTNQLQQVLIDLEARSIEVETTPQTTWFWENNVVVPATITYTTPVGNLTYHTDLQVQRFHNHWRVKWQWHDLLPDYHPQDHLLTTAEGPVLDTIEASDGQVVAQTQTWPGIFVTVDEVQSWEILKPLYQITGLYEPELLARIHQLSLPKRATLMAPLSLMATPEQTVSALQVAGITQQDILALAPLPEYRVASIRMQLLQHWPDYDELWPQKGEVVLIKPDGSEQTLLKNENQRTLTLPWTLAELLDRSSNLIDVSQLPSE